MNRRLVLVLGTVVLLALTDVVQAQTVHAGDPQSIVAALQSAGYKAELTKDDSGDPLVSSASSGTEFSVYFFGCEKGRDCTSVQFYAGYKTDKPLPFELINEWNASKRFAKVYISKTGGGRIELDVNLDPGGISRALFVDTLDVWVRAMAAFETHIGR